MIIKFLPLSLKFQDVNAVKWGNSTYFFLFMKIHLAKLAGPNFFRPSPPLRADGTELDNRDT